MIRTRTAASMRLVVLATLLVCALATPWARADDVSDLNGAPEAPAIRSVLDCLTLERQAAGLVADVADKERLDAAQAAVVSAKIEETLAAVAGAVALIDDAGEIAGFQATTEAAFAFDSLHAAVSALERLPTKLEKPVKAKVVRKALAKAEDALIAAKMSLQGVFVEGGEPLVALQAVAPLAAYYENFDRKSMRAMVPLLGTAVAAAKAPAVPRRAAAKKPRRLAAAAARTALLERARARSARRKGTAPVPPAKVGGGARDYYLALTAESKKQTEPGAGLMGLRRELRGRFATGGALGLMDPKKRDSTGQAYASFRLEVLGSVPVEYVEMRVRATEDGVQVFGETTGGTALRTKDLPGVSVADVQITYDEVNFRIYARPEGPPSATFVLVDSFFRPRVGDAWVASVGAGGLTGKAEMGVDRVYVVAH